MTRFCEWSSNVFELASDQARQDVLNFQAPRRRDLGTVAFRHTDTMIHVVGMAPHLNVEDLDANRRQCPDERFEDPALGGQAKLDEGEDASRAVHERYQRLRYADHVGA